MKISDEMKKEMADTVRKEIREHCKQKFGVDFDESKNACFSIALERMKEDRKTKSALHVIVQLIKDVLSDSDHTGKMHSLWNEIEPSDDIKAVVFDSIGRRIALVVILTLIYQAFDDEIAQDEELQQIWNDLETQMDTSVVCDQMIATAIAAAYVERYLEQEKKKND